MKCGILYCHPQIQALTSGLLKENFGGPKAPDEPRLPIRLYVAAIPSFGRSRRPQVAMPWGASELNRGATRMKSDRVLEPAARGDRLKEAREKRLGNAAAAACRGRAASRHGRAGGRGHGFPTGPHRAAPAPAPAAMHGLGETSQSESERPLV